MTRVLVIRLSSLGDVVLTTPVFANLRAAWPDARLSLLVKGAFAPVLRGHPGVDETLVFEERGAWGWLREIRRRAFDVVIDLHDTPRSRAWSFFSGAARRVRYDKRSAARRRLVWFKKSSPALAGRTVDRYLETLAPLGVPVKERTPRLFLAAGETWADGGGTGPLIAVAPGAQHATKRWPADRFAAAADQLAGSRAGARVVVLGARGDRSAAEDVLRALRSPAQSLVGRTTPRELMAVLKRSALLLTNDSGALHVAAALGVPAVAVFGPTVEAFGFFPAGDRAAVVENKGLPCRPCTLHGGARCPQSHFRCMADIGVDRVVRAAQELLNAPAV